MRVFGLIPARLESSRLPEKALLDFWGYPMVYHVAKRAELCHQLDKVIVCTDSAKIAEICLSNGINICLTQDIHSNGTERIAEAARIIGADDNDIIVDIQGDEPLVNPDTITNVVNFSKEMSHDVVVPYLEISDGDDPNRVKLVTSGENVIYMSRQNVPYQFINETKIKKHLSIIGFKFSALQAFSRSNRTELESIEGVELLRAIEIGLRVGTFKENIESLSVDTSEDYERAVRMMRHDPIFLEHFHG